MRIVDVWTVAGVILGFQATSFLWRIGNEVSRSRENRNREVTWLPVADIFNLVSMSILVLGVFVYPLFATASVQLVQRAFGLALLLFVGHCFALAGHYDLYNRKTPRSMTYFPFQERVAVSIVTLIGVLYVALSIIA